MNALYRKDGFVVDVDRTIPGNELLLYFKTGAPGIRKALREERWRGDPYSIFVELLAFRHPMMLKGNIYSVLAEVRRQRPKSRFLSVFELLTLNRKHPNIQFSCPVVTRRFTLGPSPRALYENPNRARHGQVLSLTEAFDDFLIGPDVLFAMTDATDIDTGTFTDKVIGDGVSQIFARSSA